MCEKNQKVEKCTARCVVCRTILYNVINECVVAMEKRIENVGIFITTSHLVNVLLCARLYATPHYIRSLIFATTAGCITETARRNVQNQTKSKAHTAHRHTHTVQLFFSLSMHTDCSCFAMQILLAALVYSSIGCVKQCLSERPYRTGELMTKHI